VGHAVVIWHRPNCISNLLRTALGLAIGPLPNIPLPVQIHTRICAPIVFERYGRAAASDRDYVDACYEKVCTQMQLELDLLFQGLSGKLIDI
jgi:hypothetical protein